MKRKSLTLTRLHDVAAEDTWSRHTLDSSMFEDYCVNCGQDVAEHAATYCLFQPTTYEKAVTATILQVSGEGYAVQLISESKTNMFVIKL